jgi:hypothetical protein
MSPLPWNSFAGLLGACALPQTKAPDFIVLSADPENVDDAVASFRRLQESR